MGTHEISRGKAVVRAEILESDILQSCCSSPVPDRPTVHRRVDRRLTAASSSVAIEVQPSKSPVRGTSQFDMRVNPDRDPHVTGVRARTDGLSGVR